MLVILIYLLVAIFAPLIAPYPERAVIGAPVPALVGNALARHRQPGPRHGSAG
jgi:hypothetical protein